MVGINIDNIVNKEGILDNGAFFPKNDGNNEIDVNNLYTGSDIEYGTTEKKGENIRMELIKINEAEENGKDRNSNLLWKYGKKIKRFSNLIFRLISK